MEINITAFFNSAEPSDFSASRAERGENAGKETWNNALREPLLLTTEEQLQALRDHVRGFGAWDDDEISAWSDTECNALFIQLISGDMREIESLRMSNDGETDWAECERLAEHGTIGGNLYPGDDDQIYYHLGS